MLLKQLDQVATAPGGVAKLRELILTLAVQGKLVPQDPADEPASELLKKIRAEKSRLIAEGKIKRDKPLVKIAAEEKPFALPLGWEWVRLAEIAFPQAGFAFKSSGFNEIRQGLPLIRIRDVGDSDPSTFFSGDYREEFIVESGEWLVSMDGEFRVREWSGPKALLNQRVTRLMFYGGDLCQLFVTAALQFKLNELQGTKAYTTVDHLSGGQIALSVIALPPLAEQTRIVARVEELMRLCDALEAKRQLEATQHAQLLQALLGSLTASTTPEELAANWQRVATHFDLLLDRPEAVDAMEQAILQLAVRGLLVPQDPNDEPASELLKKIRAEKNRLVAVGKIKRDKPLPPIAEDEQPFALPQGWEWVRLGALGELFDYGTSQKAVDDQRAVPILRMGNIQNGRVVMHNLKYLIDQDGDLPNLLLRKGDLLFNRTNSYELVGKTGLFEGFTREVTFASYLIRIRLVEAFGIPEYINMYMNTRDCRENEIEPDLTQQTGQANYNGTKLKNIRVPLPPLAEQSRIVARVAELRCLCHDLRQRLSRAQTQQALLAEVLV
ncbi:MAG: restriction endonuclease subunit S, partial [Pseudomonadota bacterium]|nr:restriction endonuclease subunit S [Pseudomonadota bacterium]